MVLVAQIQLSFIRFYLKDNFILSVKDNFLCSFCKRNRNLKRLDFESSCHNGWDSKEVFLEFQKTHFRHEIGKEQIGALSRAVDLALYAGYDRQNGSNDRQ